MAELRTTSSLRPPSPQKREKWEQNVKSPSPDVAFRGEGDLGGEVGKAAWIWVILLFIGMFLPLLASAQSASMMLSPAEENSRRAWYAASYSGAMSGYGLYAGDWQARSVHEVCVAAAKDLSGTNWSEFLTRMDTRAAFPGEIAGDNLFRFGWRPTVGYFPGYIANEAPHQTIETTQEFFLATRWGLGFYVRGTATWFKGYQQPLNFRRWRKDLIGDVTQSILWGRYGVFSFEAGRGTVCWSPWPTNVLLLRGDAPSYDYLRYRITLDWLEFDYFHANLSHDQGPQDARTHRFLAGHVLSVRPGWNLTASGAEVVLYGGANRNLEWFYLNPVIPFYGFQYNNRVNDNILWALSLRWNPPGGPVLWGEWLIDDFQYDRTSEPNQIGERLGAGWGRGDFWADAEVLRINNTVYGQDVAWNVYSYWGYPLGYADGNDVWALRFRGCWAAAKALSVQVTAFHQEQGEGYVGLYPVAVPFSAHFPSGVVESRTMLELAPQWSPLPLLDVGVAYRYEHIENEGHAPGAGRDRNELLLNVRYGLELTADFR